jgi:hypothetical protein
MVPVVEGDAVNVSMFSSILQGASATRDNNDEIMIPWGTISLRGSTTFIVPKGKDAYLHHEFRLSTKDSHSSYALNPTYDRKKVPQNVVEVVDNIPYNASRLNALQVIVKPARGVANLEPVKDEERDLLDYPTDEYVTTG